MDIVANIKECDRQLQVLHEQREICRKEWGRLEEECGTITAMRQGYIDTYLSQILGRPVSARLSTREE